MISSKLAEIERNLLLFFDDYDEVLVLRPNWDDAFFLWNYEIAEISHYSIGESFHSHIKSFHSYIKSKLYQEYPNPNDLLNDTFMTNHLIEALLLDVDWKIMNIFNNYSELREYLTI